MTHLTPVGISPPLRPKRRRWRGTQTDRGYGWTHQRLKRAFGVIVLGGECLCARCGELIVPGEPWDLGHDDHDRSRYTGPEHRACNRATSAHRVRRRSRRW